MFFARFSVIQMLLCLVTLTSNLGCVTVKVSPAAEGVLITHGVSNLQRNPTEACKMALLALDYTVSSLKCPESIYVAGICIRDGIGGTVQEYTKGQQLIKTAAECGFSPALEEVQATTQEHVAVLTSPGWKLLRPPDEHLEQCGLEVDSDSEDQKEALLYIAAAPLFIALFPLLAVATGVSCISGNGC